MNSNRPWLWGIVGALLAIAVTIGAVQLLRSGDDETLNAGTQPTATPSDTPTDEPSPTPSATPTTEPAEKFSVVAYFLGETGRGPRLFRELPEAAGSDAATAAVGTALTGAIDPDYSSPWATFGVTALSVTREGGDITVDLGVDDAATIHDRGALSEAEAGLAIEQVVRTAQDVTKGGPTAPVQLLVNGQHIDTIFGVPTSEGLAAADDADVLAHVWIDTPSDGATVTAGDKVDGLASSFEAAVTWKLSQGTTVVKKGFTTAAEGFTMSPYSFTLPQLAPGTYTLTVTEDDPSDGEGSGPDSDTKVISY